MMLTQVSSVSCSQVEKRFNLFSFSPLANLAIHYSKLKLMFNCAGFQVSSVQLRDDLLSMLVAGHETTGSVLTWTLYLLSKVPFVIFYFPLHLKGSCAISSMSNFLPL